MLLQEFCRLAGFDEKAQNALSPFWNRAVETFSGCPEFLTRPYLEKYLPLIGARPEIHAYLLEMADQAAALPAVQLYAWTLHRGLFLETPHGNFGGLPPLTDLLGERAGILHLMVAMSAIPLLEESFAKSPVPRSYLERILKWIGASVDLYAAGHDGLPGHNLRQTYWIRCYIEGRLYRIGRFEYLMHPAPEWLPAIYRRRADGALAVLARDGWNFDAEGYRTKDPAKIAHTAKLEMFRDRVRGTVISPRGHAVIDELRTLDPAEYEPLVSPWDLVPSIHIPGGGGMTPELAVDSIKEALAFFRRYFHTEVKLFACNSWILNPDLEVELPESNLAKFMRLLYLTPAGPSGTDRDGLFFVYGRDDQADWSSYPEETSLHRAFHRLRRAGRLLKTGGMFVLSDDLDRLRPDFYRS